MPSETDRRGKLLPSPVVPSDTVCFMIQIPNAVQYRAAFLGQINVLGVWETWDHPTDGTDCLDCEQAAQLWRNAIYQAVWAEECDPMLDCDEVAACITTSESTQAALIAQLTDNPEMQAAIQNIISGQTLPGTTATQGQPMTSSQANAQLNPLTGCNHNEFWAQCEQFTDYLVTAGTDTFEQIEIYSNAIEGATFIEMVPVLGTLMDEAQIDQVLEFINWTQEGVQELYVAADTPGNRQEIACALFCAGFDDCLITIERTWQVMNERLGGILNPSSLTSLADLAHAMVTVGTSPSLPLDLWIAFIAGAAKFAGYLGVRGIDQSLQLVLKLAINDANNDWETLCVDCPPFDPCAGGDDFTEGRQGWVNFGNFTEPTYAQYFEGEGWGRGTQITTRIGIKKQFAGPVNSVVCHWNMGASGTIRIYNYAGTTLLATQSWNANDVNSIAVPGAINGIGIEISMFTITQPIPPEQRLMCVIVS